MNFYCSLEFADYEIQKSGARIEMPDAFLGICPAALHVAIPYIFSFAHGAWFPWEKDKNAVIAFCPLGFSGMEIRKVNSKQVRLKFIEVKKKCPKHGLHDTFILPMNHDAYDYLDSVFPFLSYLKNNKNVKIALSSTYGDGGKKIAVKHRKGGNTMDEKSPCDVEMELKASSVDVAVTGMKRSCAYHRRKGRFSHEKLVPGNFCLLAYHAMYPIILSLLYGGKMNDTVAFTCPGNENKIQARIQREPKKLKGILMLLEKILRMLGKPLDIIIENVKVVVKKTEGVCPRGLKPGAGFKFGIKGYLCPSSFDSLVHCLIARIQPKGRNGSIYQCTSKQCRIQYNILKNGE